MTVLHLVRGSENLLRCPRDDSLSLSSGQADTAFADDGVVTVWQLADKFVGICIYCRLTNIFHISVGCTKPNIFEDRSVKKKMCLGIRALSPRSDLARQGLVDHARRA